MGIRFWRQAHRWIFIFFGVFMFLWLVSGLIMHTPNNAARSNVAPAPVDYAAANISPAEAVAAAREARQAPSAAITQFVLERVNGRMFYAVRFAGKPYVMIDAASGQPWEMAPPDAIELVRYHFPDAGAELRAELLERRTLIYPFGQLPVYMVSDGAGKRYFVHVRNGKLNRSTLLTKARAAIVSTHDMSFVRMFGGSQTMRTAVLWVIGLAALLGVCIGLYLALPRSVQKA